MSLFFKKSKYFTLSLYLKQRQYPEIRKNKQQPNHPPLIKAFLNIKPKECNLSNVTFSKIKHPAEKRKLGLVWCHSNKAFTSTMQKFYNVATKMYNPKRDDLI